MLRLPGLASILAAGIILISSSDIIVIYVPLLGAERHIDVHDIGLLLTMRAAASMVARLLYSRAVVAFGRWPLMIGSTFAYAASYAAFAAPLPLWAMHLAIAMMGFSFGFAATLTITITVEPVQRAHRAPPTRSASWATGSASSCCRSVPGSWRRQPDSPDCS